MYYENTYRVGARDVDPFNQCRPSSMMDFLQEAATEAAVELHVSREEMVARYHVFWMLARIWYRLDRPVCWDERVTIRTWHRGSRGASMYRDFDLLMDGKPIGEAVSVWVLADLDTHKLFRLGNVREFDDTSRRRALQGETAAQAEGFRYRWSRRRRAHCITVIPMSTAM